MSAGPSSPRISLLGLRRASVGLLILTLGAAAGASLATRRVVADSEHQVVSEESTVYATAMTAFIGQIKGLLDTAAVVAGRTSGSMTAFQQLGAGPDYRAFRSLALLHETPTGFVASSAVAPQGGTAVPPPATLLTQIEAVAPGTFAVLGFLGSGPTLAVVLADRSLTDPAFAVYAEIPLAEVTQPGVLPGAGGMDFAVYIGGKESAATLAFASTDRLPLDGTRVAIDLPVDGTGGVTPTFGTKPGYNTHRPSGLLMITAPRAQLLGWLASNLFWIFLILGLLGSLGASATLEMVLRRRDRALELVDDLARNNAALDDALAQRELAEAERVKLERQLLQSQRLEAVGQLAGGIAHDFNNLLAVILNYGDFALDALEGQSARSDVEEMLRAAQRAADLTRQLLVFSRKDIVHPEAVDLNGVVSSTSRLLERTIGEHIQLTTLLAPELPLVEADVTGLEQVLMNLVVNARDAMPDGGRLRIATEGVEVDAGYTARHPEAQPGSFVRLSVSDTGCGIAPEILEHIFEPFFTTKPAGKGTGMGLATIYAIVARWGGHINVESEPGEGSTFQILLPAFDREVVQKPEPEPTPLGQGNQQVIGVVEDEDAVREAARRILVRGGYRVLVAPDGPGAVQAFEGVPLDLLVTDVIMPNGMTGKDVAQQLHARRPDLPVIYMSGYTADIIANRGILDEDTTLVEKPFTAEVLLAAVRTALGSPAPAGGQPRARAVTPH